MATDGVHDLVSPVPHVCRSLAQFQEHRGTAVNYCSQEMPSTETQSVFNPNVWFCNISAVSFSWKCKTNIIPHGQMHEHDQRIELHLQIHYEHLIRCHWCWQKHQRGLLLIYMMWAILFSPKSSQMFLCWDWTTEKKSTCIINKIRVPMLEKSDIVIFRFSAIY